MPDIPRASEPVTDISTSDDLHSPAQFFAAANDVNCVPEGLLPGGALSPGKMLSQARLAAGLSQEQLAKKLYMTLYKVNALEADDYRRLNSDTFVRGYIRAYANLVGVDLALVLAAYDALIAQSQVHATAPLKVQAAAENSHRGAWQFLVLIGIFFIALWLISVWFFDNHNDEQYLASTVTPSSAMVAAELQVAEKSHSSLAVNPAGQAVVAVGAPSSVATPAALDAVAAPDNSARKINLDQLNFSFREESWLEVSDSRGDVLATELQMAGSTLNLVGMAPFDVKLGNAPAVEIYLNGKKMDVIPLMGSNVLTLKLSNQ